MNFRISKSLKSFSFLLFNSYNCARTRESRQELRKFMRNIKKSNPERGSVLHHISCHMFFILHLFYNFLIYILVNIKKSNPERGSFIILFLVIRLFTSFVYILCLHLLFTSFENYFHLFIYNSLLSASFKLLYFFGVVFQIWRLRVYFTLFCYTLCFF